MGSVGLGDDEEAGSVLVDPVNDAGSFLAADPRKVAAEMMEERVDQRA